MPRKKNPIPHIPDPRLRSFSEHLFREGQPEWFVSGVIEGLLSHLPRFKHKPLMKLIDGFYKLAGDEFLILSKEDHGWKDSERTLWIARNLKAVRFKRGMVADHDHDVVARHASDAISYFALHGFPIQAKNRRFDAWDHWLNCNIASIAGELQADPCICGGKLNRLLRKNKPTTYDEMKHYLDMQSIPDLIVSLVAYHHALAPATIRKIIFPAKIRADFSEFQKLQRRCKTHEEFLAKLKNIMLSPTEPVV